MPCSAEAPSRSFGAIPFFLLTFFLSPLLKKEAWKKQTKVSDCVLERVDLYLSVVYRLVCTLVYWKTKNSELYERPLDPTKFGRNTWTSS